MLRTGKVMCSLSGKPGQWVNFISDTVISNKLKWLLMVTQSDLADGLGLFQAYMVFGIRDQNSIWNLKL